MEQHPDNLPDPPDADPWLDRHLASLARFAPHPGFDDRVMARVAVPLPAWGRRLLAARRALVGTRRGRGVLTGLAAASLASVSLAGVWVSGHGAEVATAAGWVGTEVWLPVWQQGLQVAAQFVSGSAFALTSLLAPTGLAAAAAAIGLTIFGSGWGLQRLMAQPGLSRSHRHATR